MIRSIFYFDDEADCLEIFQKPFGREYDVRTAATLEEARRMLEERPGTHCHQRSTDAGEIPGAEFSREVAEAYPLSYRVMLTGSMTVGGVLAEIGSGVVQLFMPKPWQEQNMREMLERVGLHLDLRRG